MKSILLTGTIDTSVFNNTMTTLSDTQTRLLQYKKAIRWWIKKSRFDNIVFIENSGYKFDEDYFKKLAKNAGKHFEFIKGEAHIEETLEHGKSYGEIRLITEAIEKSDLLKKCDSFYKCTGRLIIKNINKLLKCAYTSDNVFLGVPSDKWVFTWFFSVEKNFYMKYLSDAYKYVYDKNGIYMEHIYYKKIVIEIDKIDTFKMYPNVAGVSAGTNSKYHSNQISLFFKNRKVKSGFFGIQ